MAVLEYQITGSVTGLASAANAATGILRNLKQTADNLKLNLLGAESASQINAIGGALTIVTGKIREYTTAAIQGSQAFKDQQTTAALETLATKITVLTGKSQIFGQSVQNQEAQVKAYLSAIDGLLKNGVDPLDRRIQGLKTNIDGLTRSIEQQKAASKTIVDPFERFRATGSLILDAENKVKNLQQAMQRATNTRDIAQYNNRLQDANAQLTALRNTGLRAADAQNTLNAATSRARGAYNGVGIELGRIIQDAPYAANNLGAIGNNITRAVEIIPSYLAQTSAMIVANGGVATSANVARAAIAGLFTGFAGISIAISALVSGFVIYQQIQQANARKAKEHTDAIEEQKRALDNYIQTLDNSSKASAKAASSYADEVTKLDILYKSLVENSNARYGNISALEELQKSWPEEFGNLQKGVGFVDTLSASYKALRENIVQVGFATAAQGLAADAQKRLVQNTVALQSATQKVIETQKEYNRLLNSAPDQAAAAIIASDISIGPDAITAAKVAFELAKDEAATFRIEAFKARQEVDKFNAAAVDAQNKIKQPVKSGLLYDLERELQRLQSIRPTIKLKPEFDLNTKAIADVQKKIDDLNGKKVKGGSETENSFKSLSTTLDDLLLKLTAFTNESGLQGYALEVQKITDKYIGLNAEIDKAVAKAGADKKLTKSERETIGGKAQVDREAAALAQRIELFNAEIAEKQRVENEIERINNEFGIKAEQNRQKELLQIKAKYDKEIKLARGNKELIDAINSGRDIAETSINKKYADAGAKDFLDFFDKIRKKQTKDAEKEEDQLGKVLSRSLRSFGQSFIDTLTSVETYAKGTFTSIFADLIGKLTQSLNKVFLDVVLDGLSKSLSSAISKGTSSLISANGKLTGLGAGIAGAGIAGGIISAATPATSTVGQGVGGALSGAAAGAAIGSVVPVIGTVAGAVVGGLVGAIGGIFGSSSARKKQEELQKQQLEEAKKQTALLEAQQRAYTAQIIGRVTSQGVITGINVGATGQLVAVVSGKDLQFVLDRNKNGR